MLDINVHSTLHCHVPSLRELSVQAAAPDMMTNSLYTHLVSDVLRHWHYSNSANKYDNITSLGVWLHWNRDHQSAVWRLQTSMDTSLSCDSTLSVISSIIDHLRMDISHDELARILAFYIDNANGIIDTLEPPQQATLIDTINRTVSRLSSRVARNVYIMSAGLLALPCPCIRRILVQFGANICTACTMAGDDAAVVAAGNGDIDRLRNILRRDRAAVQLRHNVLLQYCWGMRHGSSVLHAAAVGDNIDVVHCLLELDYDVNVLDEFYNTPLTLAADYGRLHLSTLLVSQGANLRHINATITNCNLLNIITPLSSWIHDVSTYLKVTPLHLAAQKAYTSVVNTLLLHCDPCATDYFGRSALYYSGNREIGMNICIYINVPVVLLIQAGCSVNTVDNDHMTPLNFQVTRGNYDVVEALLEHGADVGDAIQVSLDKEYPAITHLLRIWSCL